MRIVIYAILVLVIAFIFYPLVQSILTLAYWCSVTQFCGSYLEVYSDPANALSVLARIAAGGALIFVIYYLRKNKVLAK